MENNKITAEEQGTGKLGKPCSERKACRQKYLACLSSGRHEWYSYPTYPLC